MSDSINPIGVIAAGVIGGAVAAAANPAKQAFKGSKAQKLAQDAFEGTAKFAKGAKDSLKAKLTSDKVKVLFGRISTAVKDFGKLVMAGFTSAKNFTVEQFGKLAGKVDKFASTKAGKNIAKIAKNPIFIGALVGVGIYVLAKKAKAFFAADANK